MSQARPKQPSVSLQQAETRGESSNLRTGDVICAPLQRSGLNIGITLPFVVHGTYKPGGPPATLIVFNFELDTRFRKVIAISNFRYDDDDDSYPEIHCMAPKGDYVMDVSKMPTNDTPDSVASGDAVELGLGLGWEPWAKKRGPTQIELYGGLEDREVEGAIWTLDAKADGLNLPPNFMVAILLKHNDRDEVASFTAGLELEVHADVLVKGRVTSQTLITKMPINPLKYLTDASVIIPEEVDSTNLSSLGDSDGAFLKTLGSLKVRNG